MSSSEPTPHFYAARNKRRGMLKYIRCPRIGCTEQVARIKDIGIHWVDPGWVEYGEMRLTCMTCDLNFGIGNPSTLKDG